MAILKNARHEKFAQNIAKGMSATQAYEKAGYKPSEAHASRLAGYGKVRTRVAELMAPAIEATEATVPNVHTALSPNRGPTSRPIENRLPAVARREDEIDILTARAPCVYGTQKRSTSPRSPSGAP